MRRVEHRSDRNIPPALRNVWWCRALWSDARWIHSWSTETIMPPWGDARPGVSYGHRRYWRRRMSDLARTLKERYGVGVETIG